MTRWESKQQDFEKKYLIKIINVEIHEFDKTMHGLRRVPYNKLRLKLISKIKYDFLFLEWELVHCFTEWEWWRRGNISYVMIL